MSALRDDMPVLQGELVTPGRDRYRLHKELRLEVRAGYLARYANKNTRTSNATAVDQWYQWCDEPLFGWTGIYYGDAAEASHRGRVLGSTAPAYRGRVSAMAGIRGQRRLRQDVLEGLATHGPSGRLPADTWLGAAGTAGHHPTHLRRAPMLRANASRGRVAEGQRTRPGRTGASESAAVVDLPVGEAHAGSGAGDPCPSRRGGVVSEARQGVRYAPAEHRPHLPPRGLPRRDLNRAATHTVAAYVSGAG